MQPHRERAMPPRRAGRADDRSSASWLAALVVGIVLAVGPIAPALAGRPCENVQPTPAAIAQGLELGRRSFEVLEGSGAEVALIARAGQDLTRFGLRYSHMAVVWRDHPAGRWTVIHELNDCGSATSRLYEDGLGNFFLDDPFRYEALVVVPDDETQRRIVAVLRGDLPRTLHDDRYNVVAYPFSTRYQNSNQWLLELLAAALSHDFPVADRATAQVWLKGAGYRPTTLEIDALTRLGGRMFKANVAFDDHPFDRRMAGHIDVVTVESLVDFLRRRGVASQVEVVSLPTVDRRTTASAAPDGVR